ncbi:MAG: SpoIIE family protein phosphatase [Candidatus Riflebacteria bacterium]|nr:SpoIIE family protein phosphatase [Candidatus Riflebacteria bacterium]
MNFFLIFNKLLKELTKWAIPALLIFPILLILYFFLRAEFLRQYEDDKKIIREVVKEYCMEFHAANSFPERISVFFSTLQYQADGTSNPEKFLFQKIQELKKDFPGVFEMAIFDSDKHFLKNYSDLPEFHALLASFGVDLNALFNNDPSKLNNNIIQYIPLCGPFYPLGYPLESKRQFFFRSFEKKRQFVYNSGLDISNKHLTWLMVWISAEIDLEDLGYRLFLRTKNLQSTQPFQEIFDLKNSNSENSLAMIKNKTLLKNLLFLLSSGEEEALFFDNEVLFHIKISSNKELVVGFYADGSRKLSASIKQLDRKIGIAFLLLIITFRLFFSRFSKSSLKLKLLFLFCYTTIIPIILFVISAKNLMVEKNKNLEKELQVHHERILEEIDRKTFEYCSIIEEHAGKIGTECLGSDTQSNYIFIKAFQQFIRKFGPNLVMIFDAQGKEILNQMLFKKDIGLQAEKYLSFIGQFINIVVRQWLQNLNHSNFQATESTRDLAQRTIIEGIAGDIFHFISLFDINAGRFFSFSFSNYSLHVLVYLAEDLEHKVRACFLSLWVKKNLTRKFHELRKYFQNKYPESYIFISDDLTEVKENPFYAYVDSVYWQNAAQSLSTHQKIQLEGKPNLLSITRSYTLFEKSLFIASPMAPIYEELNKMAIRLVGMALFLMCFGLPAGILLSFHLLRPIKNLAKGIESMKKREFSSRLPILYNDEIGQLSITFNEMMEDMSELEIARNVQETFFPASPLKGNSWEIYGTSESASRIGGDYFDYFPLKDGRWLILIGDVSGHGVSAALVVGLVKALITHPENTIDPSYLLKMLHTVILKTIGRHHCMTCFIGIFDPAEEILSASNAGHPFPIMINSEETKSIEIIHPPLGLKNKIPFGTIHISLKEHPFVFFYTDGILEAQNKSGTPIGFANLKSALTSLMGRESVETIKSIKEWHKSETQGVTLADDATMMILQKRIV